jgi:uncharacterized protein YdeI (BOF family)
MPLPDRPVANTTIDSEWGQAVHDYTFAPSGCEASGGAVTVTTNVTLPIDTAVDDPGGYVDIAGNRLIVPADKDGWYGMSARINSVTGASTTKTRAKFVVNGTAISRATEDNEGGTNYQIAMNTYAQLTAGDIVLIQAEKIGSGTSPSVSIQALIIVRLGAELGA